MDNFDPDQFIAENGIGQTEKPTSPQIPVDSTQLNQFDPDQFINQNGIGAEPVDEAHTTLPQQALTVAEGLGEGALGAISPALEEASGLTTGADIRAREQSNPWEKGVSKAASFVGSLAVPGLGEYGLASQVGNIGEHVAAALPVALPKLASIGIKAGAEMAALATSDEISKMVTQDPDQTLGSAALNIGLSGVIGGAGGAILGSVSPLWKKFTNVSGVEKLASDFMGETKAIQEAGDPLAKAVEEISGRINETEAMRDTIREMKPGILESAMPEMNPENAAKIDAQLNEISGNIESRLNNAAKSIKTKSAVPYLSEDLQKFQSVITDPNTSFADKYLATNELKSTFQGYAKWAATEEGTAKGLLGRELSSPIREALEDTDTWGKAADVQKVTNEATTNVIKATKDFKPQLTSALMGENSVAPEKVQTLLNQTNVGKAGRKASVLRNYLEYTQKQADAINKVFVENGLEAPISSKLNPTPFINHALETEITPGVALARWANKNAVSVAGNALGEAGAGVVGGGLGALVGHPLVGAWMGEKVLSPIFSALAKPLAENAIDSVAAKSAINYVSDAIKGQRLLDDATKNMFKSGAEVISKDLIPDQESRDKLDKSLEHASNPQNAVNVGGPIGHYLPQHATTAVRTAQIAQNYLSSLKPSNPITSPLDVPIPVSKSQMEKYNRALDVAQQPLMALKYLKDGTLTPQDIQTVKTIYPGLYPAMVKKLVSSMIDHKDSGKMMPYSQRVALNSFIGGSALDSTMTPESMQSIIKSSMPEQQPQMAQKSHRGNKASGAELSQIDKVNKMFVTPSQARESNKRA